MNTEILSTLKIHKLTKNQYKRELEAGRLEENSFYLTPDEDIFIVEIDVDNETASHTPSEIAAAKEAGNFVVGRGKSSLLFDGTIFHLFDANETSAEFEYTRSNLADVDTYRYTIDADKKATLTTYSLDVGNLSNLNTTTKESIVAAINEVAAGAGGSGSGECNLLVVTVDDSTMTASHSASEIIAAHDAGKIPVVNVDAASLHLSAISGTPAVEFSTVAFSSGALVNVLVKINNDKSCELSITPIPAVPTPTESDYGKVLSATADGLVWVEQSGGSGSTVPSAEGVLF